MLLWIEISELGYEYETAHKQHMTAQSQPFPRIVYIKLPHSFIDGMFIIVGVRFRRRARRRGLGRGRRMHGPPRRRRPAPDAKFYLTYV